MELFGIVLSVPVAFVASLVYCFILTRVIVRFPTASRWLWWMSAGILAWFCIEVALLVTMGAVGARRFLGPGFYAAHIALFFLGTPALANVLMLRERAGLLGRWYAAVPLCTAFALVLVLLQYGVSEALYGIDGGNGPFSQSELGFPSRLPADIRLLFR
jgi:hypothetical protein